MDIEDWKSQLKRGTLEFSIMLMLSKRPHYGYEIMSKLDKWSILSAKESTIYPLLRRLLKEEYLSSVWQETAEGLPPRKYYSVTDKGAAYLRAMTDEWEHLQTAISEIASEDTLEKEEASTPPEN
ncbi:MAG: PadR family transcriptional regulator [Blautia sp.]|nr:PadR family transcriptional regulator [Blautia sp.]